MRKVKYIRQEKKYKPNTAISEYDLGKLFPNAESARKYLEDKIWHGKPFCPFCNSAKVYPLSRSEMWHCNGCGDQFSIRTKTVFERSKIPLDKWLLALYFFVTDRKGISSMALSKKIGITQKSAWFMCHRIREAMGSGKYETLLNGIVECDETYLGGKKKNMHKSKKTKGSGPAGKITVFGAAERGGRVISIVAPDNTRGTLQGLVERTVEKKSTVNTDEYTSYIGLNRKGYKHKKVNHSAKIFVDRMASTNTIESVWALLKRGFYGTFHKLSLKHLQRYIDEFDFRWYEGNCKYPTMERIDGILGRCGKRLAYKRLIGKDVLNLGDAVPAMFFPRA